jgi:hypothetical protein
MNRTARALAGLLCLSVVLVAVGGCGKKAPKEANDSLKAALGALPKGDAKTFVAHVVAAQRDGVSKKAQWTFFQAVKSHKIDNEFDLDVTDTTAAISTVLYFDDKQDVKSFLAFVMKKEGDAWLIDLDKTIQRQIDTNGADAFNKWQIKIVPKP